MVRLHQIQTYFNKPDNDPSSLNKSSEEEDEEPCSVCGCNLSPKLRGISSLVILKWTFSAICMTWVHFTYSAFVRVVRKLNKVFLLILYRRINYVLVSIIHLFILYKIVFKSCDSKYLLTTYYFNILETLQHYKHYK